MMRIAALAGAALLIAGCSSESPLDANAQVAEGDPEGAALPLSIGGAVPDTQGGEMEAAVNCAAALGLTAERLATMTDNARSTEIGLIRQAEDHFIAAAKRAEGSTDIEVGSSQAAIARRRGEKADEATEQAQLAIACLRRYGNAIEAQSGAGS
ncbi:MAG: hypothetical protein SXU28_00635 [Pseudomonadota bacterium]|nr:hypothetical protein [Pseudomonadota bacterium]